MTDVLGREIDGKAIELEGDLLLPEGGAVEAKVRVERLAHLERAFGGYRDDSDLDRALEQIDWDR